jgi:hypothetical protein
MARILYAGADIRESPARTDDDWTPVRREAYLLRLDVARPLSVDRLVWRQPRGPDGETAGTPLPWISAEAVLQQAMTWAALRDWVVIALGRVAADPQEEEAIAKATGADAELEVKPGWEFLGFDVADGSISGLCNCGYDKQLVAGLRRVWASRLNEHGLFLEIADALAFRWLTNKRVPAHAPFHVYGIWMVTAEDPPP